MVLDKRQRKQMLEDGIPKISFFNSAMSTRDFYYDTTDVLFKEIWKKHSNRPLELIPFETREPLLFCQIRLFDIFGIKYDDPIREEQIDYELLSYLYDKFSDRLDHLTSEKVKYFQKNAAMIGQINDMAFVNIDCNDNHYDVFYNSGFHFIELKGELSDDKITLNKIRPDFSLDVNSINREEELADVLEKIAVKTMERFNV